MYPMCDGTVSKLTTWIDNKDEKDVEIWMGLYTQDGSDAELCKKKVGVDSETGDDIYYRFYKKVTIPVSYSGFVTIDFYSSDRQSYNVTAGGKYFVAVAVTSNKGLLIQKEDQDFKMRKSNVDFKQASNQKFEDEYKGLAEEARLVWARAH